MTTHRKRKRLFINKTLQTKYVVQTLILLLIYTAFFICLLLAPYISSLLAGHPLEEQAQIARMLLNMHNSSWPILAAMIVLMSLGTIFMTHRVAGPVFRLKKTLAAVSAGRLDVDLTLREKDDLKELAQHVNVLIDDLRGIVHALQDGQATLAACITQIEGEVARQQLDAALGKALIETLAASREQSRLALAKYALNRED